MIDAIRMRLALMRWKFRAKKRRRQKIRVGNLPSFFAALNDAELAYVVLRWFDEVPTSLAAESSFEGDLDMLVDSKDLEGFCRIVACHPGDIRVDLYSDTTRLGTGYKRLPYYPPVLARQVLASRELHDVGFFRPDDGAYLRSLAYHLVYHKGLMAGVATGVDLQPTDESPHDVQNELKGLAEATGTELPSPCTLLDLHRWLTGECWDMPYDLICRWPRRNAWHDALQTIMEKELAAKMEGLSDILVFLIREDAMIDEAREFIVGRLRAKFTVLDVVELSDSQVETVSRCTRGGNWVEKRGTLTVAPRLAVICYDHSPQAVDQGSALSSKHVHVYNENVFYKHALRKELEKEMPDAGLTYIIHGADNDLESATYLEAIYGVEKLAGVGKDFIKKIADSK